ncbi:hypothetical protein PROFUN_06082 [Planoprotostelium fungivorum]|uniref:Uncharacterized protein n=1 Tax=Planoprotostelium fungivorum TaxID=1890364 RepID=A0A2P6NPS9_9EUKA|nr:hypothetical protein PROFUN_06082 [Planoprotostelium fungivorum]
MLRGSALILSRREIEDIPTVQSSDLKPLHVVVENIVSGDKKAQLSSWWLDLIETGVDHYLSSNQTFTDEGGRHIVYDTHAVPYNYIDQPPKSMEAIRHNHYIVQKLLSFSTLPVTETSSPQHVEFDRFLRGTSKEVYTHINHFETVSNGVLDLIRGNMIRVDQEKTQHLLADLNYLSEMKRLEDERFSGEKTSAGLSHIVPISGLILSKLHRIENELATVLRHWNRNIK